MDRQRKVMEDFILKQSISLLNSGSFTYLHPGNGTASAIDLSLCHPSLYFDVSWSVYQSSFNQIFLQIEMHWVVGSIIKQIGMLSLMIVAKRLN